MELLYFYIEDDGKNIKNCEFNFSPQYRFHYQKEAKYLECKEIKSYCTDFWEAENISNITAIIGKNGSGKSNLIEFIIRYCASSNGIDQSNSEIVFVYKKDESFFINRDDIRSNYTFQHKSYIQYPFNPYNQDTLTKIIYFSPHTEKFILKGLGKGIFVDDISNSGILRSDEFRHRDKNNGFTDIEYLQIRDTYRHFWLFKFLKDQNYHINFLDLKIPSSLNIRLYASDSKRDLQDPNYQKLFNDLDKNELTFEKHIQNRLLNQIFSKEKIPKIDNVNNFEDFIEDHYSGKIYKSLIEMDKQGKILFKKRAFPLGPFNFFFEFGIKTEDLTDVLLRELIDYSCKSEVYYAISTFEYNYLKNDEVSWEWCGISSGELAFYNLFGRLLDSVNIIHDTVFSEKILRNIILLLDEPETSFHPEWQRKFLSELIEFIKTTFKELKVQIIIASHSPILVSDFPTNNIIFLDRDENTGNCKVVNSIENTFGANIHSLYKNSFFLDGLPIGEFAKRKINKIIKELDEGKATKELYSQIHLIGEPLIRDQLMKLYNQNHPYNIEERISLLENELAKLKNRTNNDKN